MFRRKWLISRIWDGENCFTEGQVEDEEENEDERLRQSSFGESGW
jgi:hypothetical protein